MPDNRIMLKDAIQSDGQLACLSSDGVHMMVDNLFLRSFAKVFGSASSHAAE